MTGVGPLAGVRVVEFAGIGPGPYAALLLADLGAEVIRIDRPAAPAGSFAAADPPLLSRGRRSVLVDLKSPDGVAVALDIVRDADLLIEGFRPGVMERLGLGPKECTEANPRLIYGRMTGWGQDGPWARYAGHDVNYLALSGALAGFVRDAGDGSTPRPVPPSVVLGDLGGGALFLVIGLLAALLETRSSGVGQVVDAAILDGVRSLTTFLTAMTQVGGWSRPPGHNILDTGAPFYEVYECADGRHLSVGALEDPFYAELLARLGLDPAPDHPLHPANRHDPSRWPDGKAAFEELFATRPLAHWRQLLEYTDACAAPVLTVAESAAHPHLMARGGTVEQDGTAVPAPSPRLSRTPARVGTSPAYRGADTDAVLGELGYDAPRLRSLREAGCIA